MDSTIFDLPALISETEPLNCAEPFPLESAPSPPQHGSFRLIGRILSPNPPSISGVRDILKRSWKFALPFYVEILPANRLLFTVTDEHFVQKIMANGPWNIKGLCLWFNHGQGS
jgi:hypothetical protein